MPLMPVEASMLMARVVSAAMVDDADALVAKASMVSDLDVVQGGSAVWSAMGAGWATMVLVAMVELAPVTMGRLIE
jgi:hypothetical protein